MKSLSFLSIGLLVLFCVSTDLAQTSAFSGKSLKISQISKQRPQEGIYITQGFIAKIYVCPPCPPNANCKPCMRNNVVISEENKTLDTYNLTEKELIIFTQEPKKLIKGKKYQFKIRISNRKSTGQKLNDIELISYKIIR